MRTKFLGEDGSMKSVERISFLTYGCKVNQFDTDRIVASLSNRFTIIDDTKSSDMCIVNTCTVTNNSDSQIINVGLNTSSNASPTTLEVTYSGAGAAQQVLSFALYDVMFMLRGGVVEAQF